MNTYQVMGVGSAGSFTELTSAPVGNLSELDGLVSGDVSIRLTNTATGEITRHTITIDPATDTVNDVATAISAITGMTASVNTADQITITADPNYQFDFLPSVLPEPTLTDFDAASPPTVEVSGIYKGLINDTFTCTVIGDGAVGNGTLELEVRNGANELLRTVNIGAGYAAGDPIELGNGIIIGIGIGDLAQTDGDTFSIDAFATTDTANFLAAAGINTLFAGSSAETMAVSNDILNDPRRVATAIGAEMTDNFNVTRMADAKDTALTALDGMTCGEYYRSIATDIGQQLSTKQLHQENVEVMVLNLENQRNEVSGVDINEESAKLLVFEQMYQSMAKYMTILNESLDSLMDLA
jgi:flagellar hook-associated protein 1 FlgK